MELSLLHGWDDVWQDDHTVAALAWVRHQMLGLQVLPTLVVR